MLISFLASSGLACNDWVGPVPRIYSDQDCPNLGCSAFLDLAACEKQCDSVEGCNAFNFNAKKGAGCCLRGCSPSKVANPSITGPACRGDVAYYNPARLGPSPAPAPSPIPSPAPAPAPAPGGECAGQRPAWGDASVCLCQKNGEGCIYHCPWESSAVVATTRWGGCPNFKYGCTSTKVATVLALYAQHDHPGVSTPDNTPAGIRYVECCMRTQCYGSHENCGPPPNVWHGELEAIAPSE